MADVIIPIARTADLDVSTKYDRLPNAFFEGDVSAHRFDITCKRSGSAIDLTGATVIGYFINSARQTIIVAGTVAGSVASVLMSAACYAVSGILAVQIKVSLDGSTPTLYEGVGYVKSGPTDIVIDEEDIVASLPALLAQINACEDAEDAANTAAVAANTAAAEVDGKIEEIQSQVDLLIVEGDSSVEAAQARVPAIGDPFTTLKARLDHSDEIKRILVSVKEFYADTDTDWTDAFVAGIAFVEANGGGTLVVPPGTYEVQPDTIELDSHVALIGIGNPKLYTQHGSSYSYIINVAGGAEDVLIKGVWLDQWNETGAYDFSTNKMPALTIGQVTGNVTIEDCELTFIGVWALTGWTHNVDAKIFIRRNKIRFKRQSDTYYDVSLAYIESFYHEFDNNVLRNETLETYEFAYSCGGFESHGHQAYIRNNDVTQGVVTAFNIVNYESYVDDRRGFRVIENNNCYGVQTGVKFWPISDDIGIENVEIRNNYISLDILNPYVLNGVDRYSNYYGVGIVDLGGTLHNIRIAGNRIVFPGEVPVEVAGVWEYGIPQAYAGGVALTNIEDFEISGNSFEGLPFPAINTSFSSETSYHGKIFGNTIKNCVKMNALTPDVPGGVFTIGSTFDTNIYNNKIVFDDTIDYNTDDIVDFKLIWMRGYSGASNIPSNVKFTNNEVIGGHKFISYALEHYHYDTDDNYIDFDCLRHIKNVYPTLGGVQAQAVPTSGSYYLGDRLLYDGDTTIAGYRGYKCTEGGTSGTAVCTVSYAGGNDGRWLLLKVESGDVNIGDWVYVDGHGGDGGIVITKAVADDGYSYIVVQDIDKYSFSFTGTCNLVYYNPTFAIMA